MRIDGGDSKDTIYVSIDEHTETEDLYCNKKVYFTKQKHYRNRRNLDGADVFSCVGNF